MEPSRWLASWEAGRTGFHRDSVHDDLLDHAGWLVEGGQRVLVPLCGMSRDLRWLADRGLEVVGVELSPIAVRRLFEREGWAWEPEPVGPFVRHRAGPVTVLQGDLFDLTPEHAGRFDRLWDRAALVALPPAMRARYAPQLRSVATAGARLLQNAFTYDQSLRDGPPFSVPGGEIAGLYMGADIERVRHEDVVDKVAFEGVDAWWVSTYRITLP